LPPPPAAKSSRNVATVPQAQRDVRLGKQRALLQANQAAASSSSSRSGIAAQQAALTGRGRRVVEEQVRREICGSEMNTQYLFFSQWFFVSRAFGSRACQIMPVGRARQNALSSLIASMHLFLSHAPFPTGKKIILRMGMRESESSKSWCRPLLGISSNPRSPLSPFLLLISLCAAAAEESQ
jgi:hypothetical protein